MAVDSEASEPEKSDELLILNCISNDTDTQKYVACFEKQIIQAIVDTNSIDKLGICCIPFGSVVNCQIVKETDTLIVHNIKNVFSLHQLRIHPIWSQLSIGFDENLNEDVIFCNALTNGCFTYQNVEYKFPAVFNDILGIISDHPHRLLLPKKQIGRLSCTVTVENIDGIWKFYIAEVTSFEKVFSQVMTAQIEGSEHYGLVTREECDLKRDLRLVSTRDFPRDVRIFRNTSHCCETNTPAARNKQNHDHAKCVESGVGDANLLGAAVAITMKKCHGMTPQSASDFSSSEGYHVDGKSLRTDVPQLSVNVHGGFVEVETICEYSGYTDHSGFPLLWSHDVEFIVDFSKIFNNQPYGLYIVKAVRFHRLNVFAKWRLARRAPIMKSLQTKFHSRETHSLNLATLGVGENCEHRRTSVSRFGGVHESCCLPRTDSLDNLALFDAIFCNLSVSSGGVEKEEEEEGEKNDEEDQEMWQHHASAALKIVDEADTQENDENSKHVA